MFLYFCLALLVCFNSVMAIQEPKCSKFDYEEKMLAKMIRMEVEFEQLEKKMEEIKDMIQSFENNRVVLQLEEKINVLQQEQVDLKAELGRNFTAGSSVVFKSYGVRNLTPSKGETIVFQNTLLNEGNGYDPGTGVFTAPVDGLYYFTAQLCNSGQDKYITFQLLVNDKEYGRGLVYGTRNSCGTADAFARMSKGYRVFVKKIYGYDLQENEHRLLSFSGVLLNK